MPNTAIMQDGAIILGLAALSAIILTLLIERYGPSLLQTTVRALNDYVRFDVYERAKYRFEKEGLNWLGFTHKTALAAGACGLAVYIVMKIAVGFLEYWYIFAAVLVFVLYFFSIIGYRVSGPGLDLRARFGRSCRHFFSPTINGLAIFSMDGVVALAKKLIASLLV